MTSNLRVASVAFALALGFSLVGSANAAGVRALFLAGDLFGSEENAKGDIIGLDSRFDQVGSSAYNYYTFGNGNNYVGTSGNPTLQFLQQFDAILFWSNYWFRQSTMMA